MAIAGFAKAHTPHYPPEAFGVGCWGPVGIQDVVSFCKELNRLLESGEGVAIFSSERLGMSANVALLVGAYLILQLGMPASEAIRCLPAAAMKQRFPTPWAASPQFHAHYLNVESCLQGLAAAARRGWLDYAGFDLDEWNRNYKSFDATLVCQVPLGEPHSPGAAELKVWAIADPVTTVADSKVRPSPPDDGFVSDYSEVQSKKINRARLQSGGLSPLQLESESSTCLSGSAVDELTPCSPCSAPVRTGTKEASDMGSGLGLDSWLWRERLHHWSVQQHRQGTEVTQLVKKRSKASMPEFGGWLQAQRCHRLVRLNYQNEKNLPPGGSYADYFTKWHIRQEGFEFADRTPPSQAIVDAFVKFMDGVCEASALDHMRGGSVVVHCTAGLGRTMTLLGSFAVEKLGISGPAWLGWARMCRPGSVQTLEQESFLWTRRAERDGGAGVSFCACLSLFGRSRRTAKTLEDKDDDKKHEASHAVDDPVAGRLEDRDATWQSFRRMTV